VLCLQSQASDPQLAYLSISMPPLCHGILPKELSSKTIEMVKGLCPNVVEIIDPAKEGYQLTLKLNLNQIPRNKGLFPLTTDLQHGCHIQLIITTTAVLTNILFVISVSTENNGISW